MTVRSTDVNDNADYYHQDVADPEFGLVVVLGDPATLAAALLAARSQPEIYGPWGESGRRHVLKTLSAWIFSKGGSARRTLVRG